MLKYKTAFLIGSALILSSCARDNSNGSDRPVIAVSIEPQRQLLEQLAGDRFEVVTMLSRGSDPETYEPALSVRRQADNAEAYFAIGAFPFEQKIMSSLPDDVISVYISDGIEPVYGTHGHSHAHSDVEEADPHVWTSVPNMKIMVANMAHELAAIDPDGSALYRKRAEALNMHLDSIDSAIRSRIPSGTAFSIWHPSLSYFARDYGLRQIAVGYESKEMPAMRLKAVIDSAKLNNVKVLFFQKEYDSRQAESINDAIGSEFVEIDPLAYDWESELTKIADALSRP